MPRLNPCPFCNSYNVEPLLGNITCWDCNVTISWSGKNIESSINAYNTRPSAKVEWIEDTLYELNFPTLIENELSWEDYAIPLLAAGKKISAIQICRRLTGMGIRDAKFAVEAL